MPSRGRVGCLAACLWMAAACGRGPEFPPDDAKVAGLTAADFPQTSADIFKEMDGGLLLTEDEIKAGNQVFWDRLARESYGLVDLLKILDSRRRSTRFAKMGLINEPGFRTAERPDQFGLWIDERAEAAPPGVDETIYGRSSGVIGLRIFPNPA